MNLHAIVRSPITSVYPDKVIYLIQALGQENVKGILKASYAAAQPVKAQIQMFGADDLQALNETLRTEILRKIYLFSDTYAGHKPEGQNRHLALPEDFLYIPEDKSFWKVFQVSEDFSDAGWVSIGAVLQVQVPEEVLKQVPSLLINKV